jgi:hypothetical protein
MGMRALTLYPLPQGEGKKVHISFPANLFCDIAAAC